MSEYLRGFVTAARLLTIVPVPGRESERQSSALYWFPVLGCIIGGLYYGVARLTGTLPGNWPEGTAVLLVAVGAVLTGGLHLDGLADWADSLGCMHDREKMLRVMKDSRIGTFGVIALALVLLAKWAAMARLIACHGTVLIVVAAIASRTTMAGLAACLPYARPEGGTGQNIVTTAGLRHLLAASALCTILVSLVTGTKGIVLLAGGIAVTCLLGGWSKWRLGGITGDILGACSELTETVVLLTAGFLIG